MEYKKNRTNEFKIDNAMSDISEIYVLNWLRTEKGCPTAYKREGFVKECDYEVPELKCKMELKTDLRSNDTGNLFIEVNFNKSPSGIMTSSSKYWLISDGKVIRMFKKKELFDMHQSKQYQTRNFNNYGNIALGMILPIEDISESRIVHTIDKDSEAYIDNLQATRERLTKEIYGLE